MLQHDNLEIHQKTIRLCCVLVLAAVIISPLSADYAIQGDINNDGRIDTTEAIFALQVA